VTPGGTRSRPRIFGILNVTPDSFSDGGNFFSVESAVAQGIALAGAGADVIDVGGESTRPGATPVEPREELRRVIPIIEALNEKTAAKLSIDTVKASVARAAIQAGADIVNDVSGLRLDPEMPAVCSRAGCEVVLMHSRGTVGQMASYEMAAYGADPVGDIIAELLETVRRAEAAGIAAGKITVDPGIGFSKRTEHSLAVLAGLSRLVEHGYPVMVGVSRKRVVAELMAGAGASSGAASGVPMGKRDAMTVQLNVAAFLAGAASFRVHDVTANRAALDEAWKVVSGV
jgi:dihydropteroate synthase